MVIFGSERDNVHTTPVNIICTYVVLWYCILPCDPLSKKAEGSTVAHSLRSFVAAGTLFGGFVQSIRCTSTPRLIDGQPFAYFSWAPIDQWLCEMLVSGAPRRKTRMCLLEQHKAQPRNDLVAGGCVTKRGNEKQEPDNVENLGGLSCFHKTGDSKQLIGRANGRKLFVDV